MRNCCDLYRRSCAVRFSWLAVILLHDNVVQSSELDVQHGDTCEADLAESDGQSRSAECAGRSPPQEQILMQIAKSQLQSEQSVDDSHPHPQLASSHAGHQPGLIQALKMQDTASHASTKAQRDASSSVPIPHQNERRAVGHIGANIASLLAMAKVMHKDNGELTKVPTFWVVVLALSVAVCVMLFIVRAVSDQSDDGSKLKRTQATGAPMPNSTISLPSTPGSRAVSQNQLGTPLQSRPLLSQQASPATTAARHLCPGLVVPHGNECILAVPALPSTGAPGLEIAALNVQDLDGKSVIQAEVVLPNSPRAGVAMTQRPLVVLRAGSVPRAAGQQVQPLLAYCKASHEVGARKSVYVYDARDELFATIVKDSGNFRYILTSGRISLRLCFEGDIAKHAVTVTNDQRQTVAETTPAVMAFNPTGQYHKLRVVSNVDVGLMLCALFAIDCMEAF